MYSVFFFTFQGEYIKPILEMGKNKDKFSRRKARLLCGPRLLNLDAFLLLHSKVPLSTLKVVTGS